MVQTWLGRTSSLINSTVKYMLSSFAVLSGLLEDGTLRILHRTSTPCMRYSISSARSTQDDEFEEIVLISTLQSPLSDWTFLFVTNYLKYLVYDTLVDNVAKSNITGAAEEEGEPVAGTVVKQHRTWMLLGWVSAERSCPCKQPTCPAIGGGSDSHQAIPISATCSEIYSYSEEASTKISKKVVIFILLHEKLRKQLRVLEGAEGPARDWVSESGGVRSKLPTKGTLPTQRFHFIKSGTTNPSSPPYTMFTTLDP
ncbi:hypothetical protein J6590_040506 [Homalodisca vitripennis]|nr:hypothetical protein J6590_040506 [Homalodisca vitripennis]